MAALPARITEKCVFRPKYRRDIGEIPQLTEDRATALRIVTEKYPFLINDYYLGLINWEAPQDPIRRLVIPHERELSKWGRLDASNEASNTVCRGVQHKYKSTAVFLVANQCGGLCRYCFRKRLFSSGRDEIEPDIGPGIAYLREHPEINNVLVTGGDPLTLSTGKLRSILEELYAIDHLRTIRIGSKMLAFDPFRVINDPDLVELLRQYSRPHRRLYLMCHFDHPRELTPQSREAIGLLLDAGVICLNQSPIIRGISDDADVLAQLWNELSFLGISQYYIFQNRPTEGNEPYTVPLVEAYQIIEKAKTKCSGLAKRAKYVMSHESGKIEIVGVNEKYIYLKYHRAKSSKNDQRFFVCLRNDEANWLDQLPPAPGFMNDYYQTPQAAEDPQGEKNLGEHRTLPHCPD